MKIVICTNCLNKLLEYQSLAKWNFYCTQTDVVDYVCAEETGDTFRANAFIKFGEFYNAYVQNNVYLKSGTLVLADDSGLVIPKLKHIRPEYQKSQFPGVHSRSWLPNVKEDYYGDVKRNQRIFEMARSLKGRDRRAYMCVSAVYGFVERDGSIIAQTYEHVIQGTLADRLKVGGQDWFGFDPIFIPSGQTETLAEMSIKERALLNPRKYVMGDVCNHLNQVVAC